MKNLSLQSMQANPLRASAENTKVEARSNQFNVTADKSSFQKTLNNQVQARQQVQSRQMQNNQNQTKQALERKERTINSDDNNATNAESIANEILESKLKKHAKFEDATMEVLEGIEKTPEASPNLVMNIDQAPLQLDKDLQPPVELTQSASTSINPELMVSIVSGTLASSNYLKDFKNKDSLSTDTSDSKQEIPYNDKVLTSVDLLQSKLVTNAPQANVLNTDLQSNLKVEPQSLNNRVFDEKSASQNSRPFDLVMPDGKVLTDNNLMRETASNGVESIKNKEKLITEVFSSVSPQPTVSTSMTNSVVAAQQVGSANTIQSTPGKSGWDQAISQKVIWMVNAGEQSATLSLNPPDLGPLQVVIRVHNDQADTTFISGNAEVRQALENGLSSLREKMSESGIQLGQANVSSNSQSQQSFQQPTSSQLRGQMAGALVNGASQSTVNDDASTHLISNGLVDTFA